MLNDDYKDMLQCLSEENVKFLLVGSYAVAAYGYPRATKDIDIFVRAAPDNASSLMRAPAHFGAPLSGVSAADFSTEGIVFQIGDSPRRIDILTRISGVDFQQAYGRRTTVTLEGMDRQLSRARFTVHRQDASGRGRDRAAGADGEHGSWLALTPRVSLCRRKAVSLSGRR